MDSASRPSARRTFKIHACLGRGGFGEVYRATMYEGEASAEVAVKVLHQEIDPTDQAVLRLRDERRILAALRHPCILRVHDLVVLEGRIGLVTEFVEGQDLDKCNAGDDAMSPRAVLEAVACVADALDAAWHAPAPTGAGALQIVHRDVKPQNVRVGRRGEVKLLDFGVARAEHVGREARTQNDTAMGSYPYMAPERFLSASAHASGDVYGLGCTLFESLCGERLWQLPLQEIYKLVLNESRYLDALRERLDTLAVPAVRPLLLELLDFDADRRPTAAAARERFREVARQVEGDDLEVWARRRRWPDVRVLPGMLAGRVFEEDAVDPEQADNIGRPLVWDPSDQEPTVHMRGYEAPTVLRTPYPVARQVSPPVAANDAVVRRTVPAPAPPPRAVPARARPRHVARLDSQAAAPPVAPIPDLPEPPEEASRAVQLLQVGVVLSFTGLLLVIVFFVAFTTIFAVLRQWG